MNKMKLHALSTLTALFAGIASVNGLPATAEAAIPDAAERMPEVSPEMLTAMQRDLKLDENQARRRLAFETKAGSLEKSLTAQLGERFGGAWLNAEGTQLIVGVTDEASAARVRRAGAEPRIVKHSKATLDRVMAELDRNAANAPASVHSWYVDVATNSVVVQADATQGFLAARAQSFAALGGADEGAIRVESSTEAPRPAYDLRGGEAYFIGTGAGGSYGACSVGFPVAGGFVTAGHCGSAGTPTLGHNWQAQGTIRASVWPGSDYAWVAVNGNWTPQPWVYNYNNGNVLVHGSNEAAIGASICRSGNTTQWRCGTLQAKGITVNYSDGPVRGLHRTDACANPGDSGGSVISGNQAQGVTSGIAGGCGVSGPQTFYQPINPILSAYGLRLITSGGGDGGGGNSFVSRMNGKCIDVPNSNFSDGVRVQMWTCNNTNAQKFTWDGQRLKIGGKCLDVAGASTADGTPIQLANCNGNRAQDFVISGAGDLVSYLANKCVDIEGFNANDGAKLSIYNCTGTSNQKWDFR
ncbi:MAG: ricin-type beta-trefoil lectin domain protein [Cystobacter sp.]